MFMLLGQIVAVSFATNLFLLSILVSQPLNPSPFLKSIDGDGLISFLCLQFLILPGLGSTAVLPTVLSTPSFMPTLLIPHLLLFVPPAICDLSSKVGFAGGLIQAIEREKEKMYTTIIVASLILQIFVTYSAVKESGFGGIKKALYEHPAASSVGWDVICCWVSWGIWGLVEG
jgi:hypothetical protein